MPVDPVEPLLRGLIAHAYAYEELAPTPPCAAAWNRVYDALLAHRWWARPTRRNA